MNVNVSQQFLNKWMKISHVFQRLSFHRILEDGPYNPWNKKIPMSWKSGNRNLLYSAVYLQLTSVISCHFAVPAYVCKNHDHPTHFHKPCRKTSVKEIQLGPYRAMQRPGKIPE